MRWRWRWRPGAPEAVFGMVLLLCLVGGRSRLLNDPGTFWHLRLGRDILRDGDVPRVDTLTASRQGTPWVDQSWAFDASLALLVDHGGWPLAIAASALLLAWTYGELVRRLLRDGASPPVATLVGMLAAGMGATHFLVRPHLITLLLAVVTLDLCRSYHHHGGRSIWAVPPLIALWANLHGGFLAGPFIVASAGLAHLLSVPRDGPWRRRVGGFALILILGLAAPCLNPYDMGLYRHVFHLLYSAQVTDLIDEYQPPPFGQSKALVFELVLLGLVAAPAFARHRPSRYDLTILMAWVHPALTSIRNVPLFALAAAPALASWLDGDSATTLTVRRDGRPSPWPLLASLATMAAATGGLLPGGPDPTRWPLKALPVLARQPSEDRLFHELNWGGLIEWYSPSIHQSYLDDRFELWGRRPILAYLEALEGGAGWDVLRDREGFAMVWVRPGRGLARRLAADPGWTIVHRDPVSVLFRRRPTERTQRPPG